jgi:hypothetical protein
VNQIPSRPAGEQEPALILITTACLVPGDDVDLLLRAHGLRTRHAPLSGARSPAELAEILDGATAAIVGNEPLTAAVVEQHPHLRDRAHGGWGTTASTSTPQPGWAFQSATCPASTPLPWPSTPTASSCPRRGISPHSQWRRHVRRPTHPARAVRLRLPARSTDSCDSTHDQAWSTKQPSSPRFNEELLPAPSWTSGLQAAHEVIETLDGRPRTSLNSQLPKFGRR